MAHTINATTTTNIVLSRRAGEYSYVRINGTGLKIGHKVKITSGGTDWTGDAFEENAAKTFLVARLRHDAKEMTKDPLRPKVVAPAIVQVTVTDAATMDTATEDISVVIIT
ncbi:MAG: hypothetical protein U0871_21430 [Gemmataceae bacterium]